MALTLITEPLVPKTSTYTVTLSDRIVLANGTFTVNLYTAVGNVGRVITIKNTGAGNITVDASGSETIDGALTVLLAPKQGFTIESDGATWWIISTIGRTVIPVGSNLWAQ